MYIDNLNIQNLTWMKGAKGGYEFLNENDEALEL